jgi:hypothetical protein
MRLGIPLSHAMNILKSSFQKNDDFFMPSATFLSSTASHLQIPNRPKPNKYLNGLILTTHPLKEPDR